MQKIFKILATTAALAAIIPLSVYADSATSTPAPNTSKDTTKIEHNFAGGFAKKQISADLLKKLNLDEKTFQDKVKKGETLAQIAQDQGLSRDALKALLTTDFNQKLDKQKADFAANLDALVDGKGKAGLFGGDSGEKGVHGPKVGNRIGFSLDTSGIATLLGITNEELKTALTSGKSLADVATEKGVDVQKLIDLQVASLLKGSDQDLKDGKITQADYDKRKAEFTNMATKIINNKHNAKDHKTNSNVQPTAAPTVQS
ncbi:MAG: hypothetical protein JWM44_2281 [Bacilli bacterium]|nr:hypothetical protein [Bacilli bacterium]